MYLVLVGCKNGDDEWALEMLSVDGTGAYERSCRIDDGEMQSELPIDRHLHRYHCLDDK